MAPEVAVNTPDGGPIRVKFATIGMVCGVFFTVTFPLAIVGIPCLIGSWWCWNFGKKNIEAVESGYAQFMASLQPAVATV